MRCLYLHRCVMYAPRRLDVPPVRRDRWHMRVRGGGGLGCRGLLVSTARSRAVQAGARARAFVIVRRSNAASIRSEARRRSEGTTPSGPSGLAGSSPSTRCAWGVVGWPPCRTIGYVVDSSSRSVSQTLTLTSGSSRCASRATAGTQRSTKEGGAPPPPPPHPGRVGQRSTRRSDIVSSVRRMHLGVALPSGSAGGAGS